MSFDLKTAIGSIAPTLATMLGGPLAGTAIGALVNAFGLTATGDNARDAAAITSIVQNGTVTPDMIASVRAADQHHAEIMEQQNIDLLKLNGDHEVAMAQLSTVDAANARAREIAVKDNTPAVLAYSIIGGFFVLSGAQLAVIMGYPDIAAKIPSQGWLLVGNISGYLAAEAKAAASYYFGSTSGSKAKDATIDTALNG